MYARNKWKEALQIVQFVLLGCSGWWSSNAIWSAEQPIYIIDFAAQGQGFNGNATAAGDAGANLPIATNLAVACQLGNIGPILYNGLWSFVLPLAILWRGACDGRATERKERRDAERSLLRSESGGAEAAAAEDALTAAAWEAAKSRSTVAQRNAVLPTLTFCLLAAAGACVLAALLWDQTATIWGSEVHIWLLIAEVIAGTTGCMSAVTFWSFTMRFSKNSVKALSVGLSIGSVASQGLALFQQQGRDAQEPRISVRVYLLIAAAVQLLFFFNFLLLARSASSGALSTADVRTNYDDELPSVAADDETGNGGRSESGSGRVSEGFSDLPSHSAAIAPEGVAPANPGSVGGGSESTALATGTKVSEIRYYGASSLNAPLHREEEAEGQSSESDAGADANTNAARRPLAVPARLLQSGTTNRKMSAFSPSFRGSLPSGPPFFTEERLTARAESGNGGNGRRAGAAAFDSDGAGPVDLAHALATTEEGGRGDKSESASSSMSTLETRVRIVVVFVIYAATYALPALQPYMVRSYQDRPGGFYANLLLWMSNMQFIADPLGRTFFAFAPRCMASASFCCVLCVCVGREGGREGGGLSGVVRARGWVEEGVLSRSAPCAHTHSTLAPASPLDQSLLSLSLHRRNVADVTVQRRWDRLYRARIVSTARLEQRGGALARLSPRSLALRSVLHALLRVLLHKRFLHHSNVHVVAGRGGGGDNDIRAGGGRLEVDGVVRSDRLLSRHDGHLCPHPCWRH